MFNNEVERNFWEYYVFQCMMAYYPQLFKWDPKTPDIPGGPPGSKLVNQCQHLMFSNVIHAGFRLQDYVKIFFDHYHVSQILVGINNYIMTSFIGFMTDKVTWNVDQSVSIHWWIVESVFALFSHLTSGCRENGQENLDKILSSNPSFRNQTTQLHHSGGTGGT